MLNIQTKLFKNQKIFEDLVIKRKSWKGKTGETYYAYLVKSELRGMEVVINFKGVKNDPIMYRNLALFFETSDKVYLMVEFNKDDPRYNLYYAVSVDENGALGKAGIVPSARSDRDMLDNIIEVVLVKERKEYLANREEDEEEPSLFASEEEPEEELIPVEEPESKGKKGKKAE